MSRSANWGWVISRKVSRMARVAPPVISRSRVSMRSASGIWTRNRTSLLDLSRSMMPYSLELDTRDTDPCEDGALGARDEPPGDDLIHPGDGQFQIVVVGVNGLLVGAGHNLQLSEQLLLVLFHNIEVLVICYLWTGEC